MIDDRRRYGRLYFFEGNVSPQQFINATPRSGLFAVRTCRDEVLEQLDFVIARRMAAMELIEIQTPEMPDASHSVYESRPKEVAAVIKQAAQQLSTSRAEPIRRALSLRAISNA